MRRPLVAVALTIGAASFALAQQAPEPDSADVWRPGALAMVPHGYVAGEVSVCTGFEKMTGYLPVFPVGSNDPATPASVFAPRQALAVRLVRVDGKLQAVSAELEPRTGIGMGTCDDQMADPTRIEREYRDLHDALAEKRPTLPPGTEPCDLGAWSEDKDPKGLNVRAEPSAKARVLGTLSPPYRLKMGGRENTPKGGWLTEFRIIGFKGGWFLIEGAEPPGRRYEDETRYPKNAPKPYAGRGWVAASKVGANYANGSTIMGGLFQAPDISARWMPAQHRLGGTLDTDGGPKRVLACSGLWGLVESHDGVRGWWRRLCSNQVTNCS